MKRITLIFFIIPSLYSLAVYSKDIVGKSIWVFDKASETDVFGESNQVMVKHLYEMYKQVSIVTTDKKITIKDNLLADNNVCSTEIVRIPKTPLSYFLSKKTVNLYEQIFRGNGLRLPENIYIITSLFPQKECPVPYNEIIDINEYLTVQDRNHFLFFKSVKYDEANKNASQSNWLSFCNLQQPTYQYEGVIKHSCFFPGMKLNQAYYKFINSYPESYLLKKTLPNINEVYEFKDTLVNYEWPRMNVLNIKMNIDNEIRFFNFSEKASGTQLEFKEETQY